jgi:hypothetical protein
MPVEAVGMKRSIDVLQHKYMELAVKALQLWREKKITTVRMYVLTGMDV